jgi:hypothetical protein
LRLSITLATDFRIETLEEALARHGKPEIFNTDSALLTTGLAELNACFGSCSRFVPMCRRSECQFSSTTNSA